MTLIVGIRCEDGVVVAADSVATIGAQFGGNTVEQSVSKLEIQHDCVIVGTSGSVGLSQLIRDELDKQLPNIINKKPRISDARQKLSEHIWKPIQQQMVRTEVLAKVAGPRVMASAICLTLVAVPLQDQPILIEFSADGASEEKTTALPFVAIGSGQNWADPFLAFLKRVLWNDSCPKTVGEGIFAALWTVDHVIRVNPNGGIGGDPSVAVLSKRGDSWVAEHLNKEQIQEHYQAIAGAENAVNEYVRGLASPPAAE